MKKIKRKKLSIKKLSIFIIIFIIITCGIIFRKNITYFIQSKITGYNYDTIEAFHELDIYDDIKDHDYSKTTENIVKTEWFNKDYLNSYLTINYKDTKDYYDEINKLLNLGYNASEINNIYDSLNHDSISKIIANKYLKDISNIIKLSYFKEDNIERYLKYNTLSELSTEDLITYVNIGLDNKYYTNVINIDKPSDIEVIVNKYHKLASDYVPSDLEAVNPKYNRGYNNKMRKIARAAFEEMCEAALKDNIKIYSGSAYRSYSYQEGLYNRYVSTNGFAEAETFSARAGYSEHQTGLATDIMNAKIDYISESDQEYTWLVNNSYKYGFILRYPKGKEKITGYMYEEWHFRYVGKDIASYVTENKITYDEYVARNS